MITERPGRPPDEALRLAALHAYEIVESAKESRFDRIAALAAGYFRAPIAVISLLDEHRLWIKAAFGTDITEVERDLALCAYTVDNRQVTVVEDALSDERFRTNSFVTGNRIRFYAGAPLVTPEGYAIGTMSILDGTPRSFCDADREILKDFAEIVIDELELRKSFLHEFQDTARLRSILATSPLAIYTVDRDGSVLTWNPVAEEMYGWSAAEVIGKALPIIDDDVRTDFDSIRSRVFNGEVLRGHRALARRRRDGSTIDLSLSCAPMRDEHGDVTSIVTFAEDITQQTRVERRDAHRSRVLELAATGATLREALDEIIAMVGAEFPGSMALIALVDGDRWRFGAASQTTPETFAAELEGAVITPNFTPCATAVLTKRTAIVRDLTTQPQWEVSERMTALGVRSIWSEPIIARDGNALGSIAIYFRTVTDPRSQDLRELTDAANLTEIVLERFSDRANLERLALYDSLTSLPNRVLFANRLRQSLEIAERVGRPIAVGMIDLDRFKAVNDTYGHRIGDDVLERVARLFVDVLRPSDTLARRGGDEFLVLLPDVTSTAAAHEIGERLRDAVRAELEVGKLDIFIRASIGIALIDPAATIASIDELIDRGLQEADLAMYEAKKRGDEIVVYTPEIGSPKNYALEPMLGRARALDELVLYYQPQIDTETGALTGCEALLRWNNPRLGLLYPADFLSVAEESGLIVSIGAWALEEACREAKRWHDLGSRITIAVNVSPRQFETDDIVSVVRGALEHSGLDPCFLEIEISEKLVVGANLRATLLLRNLKELGVRLSIDDFGTGYSNLASLHEFNVHGLKIDKSFVDRLATASDDHRTAREIVKTIVSLARALGLTTVAEGVETVEQRDLLRAAGCPVMQGYLWSPALSSSAFETWRSAFTKPLVT